MYAILVSLVQGKALQIVRTVRTQSGYEVFRLLTRHYEPVTAARQLNLLFGIIEGNKLKDLSYDNLDEKIMTWEHEITEYETLAGERMQDLVKTAVLLRSAPNDLKEYLHMHSDKFGTYQA